MGSSTSKPRKGKKGNKKPQHLPKVGTPANLEHRHAGERQDAFAVFGKSWTIVIAVLVVLGIIGWFFLTA